MSGQWKECGIVTIKWPQYTKHQVGAGKYMQSFIFCRICSKNLQCCDCPKSSTLFLTVYVKHQIVPPGSYGVVINETRYSLVLCHLFWWSVKLFLFTLFWVSLFFLVFNTNGEMWMTKLKLCVFTYSYGLCWNKFVKFLKQMIMSPGTISTWQTEICHMGTKNKDLALSGWF